MSRYRHAGLAREPFAPDPDLAFQSPTLGQTDALVRLTDFVAGRGALALTLGAAGIGKSMLRLALTRDLAAWPALRIMTLDRPGEWNTDVAFLRTTAFALGGEASGRTTLDLLTEIETRLTEYAADDHWPLLLIDDAHRLTSSQLELLRTISSLEPDRLSIILFAEPDLDERIARRRSLAGRVALRHTLNPLNTHDAVRLLRHRLAVAGQTETGIFDDDALDTIAHRSGGNPGRLIALAAESLNLAARRNAPLVDRSIVNEADGAPAEAGPVARQIAFELIEPETGRGSRT